MSLKKDPDRFMANANDPWVQNTTYRHPGWHFFEQVESSSIYSGQLQAQFKTEKIPGKQLYMNLFITGSPGREYSRVMAPVTYEAPSPYDELPTPTLVIRQNGEAWTRPFVVVYEPADGSPENSNIQSVEAIRQDGIYKGVKVISGFEDRSVIQYILTQSTGDVFSDDQSGIFFEGGFAVITTDQNNKVLSMYMGDGRKLQFGEKIIESKDGKDLGAYLDFKGESALIKSNRDGDIVYMEKQID